ncbi:MAG: hypothetical protein ACQ5SW_09095, partial [Sphaerochaetaceae bacterium]
EVRKELGYDQLVARGTGVAQGFDKTENSWGFHTTDRLWNHWITIGKNWWNKHGHDKPLPMRFIDESFDITERNTDVGVAFLAALMLSNELDLREANGLSKEKHEPTKQKVDLWIMEGGRIIPSVSNQMNHPFARRSASHQLYEDITNGR